MRPDRGLAVWLGTPTQAVFLPRKICQVICRSRTPKWVWRGAAGARGHPARDTSLLSLSALCGEGQGGSLAPPWGLDEGVSLRILAHVVGVQ